MSKEYKIYKMNRRLYGHALAQEDVKNWLYPNIFITRLGIAKEFQKQTPRGYSYNTRIWEFRNSHKKYI